MSRILSFSLAAIALFSYVAADSETTLIVPFGDPQAISADILGVDTAKGRTTWQLRQGAYTGTWTDPQGSFPATATLVEGADYASFTYSVPALDAEDPAFAIAGECSLGAGNVEVCVVAQSVGSEVQTVTETDTVTPFGVQIAAATGVPASGASGGSSGGASGAQSGSTPTGSAPTSTQSGSSMRTTASGFGGALAALLLAYHFL
ncbi:hypothetical protein B0H14DRAFT_3880009 [Mycena olivaceomarginata]|nr:hypothetical protein B0H14DRAFT_3880009 [Mycena olivaceomarginata]